MQTTEKEVATISWIDFSPVINKLEETNQKIDDLIEALDKLIEAIYE